MSATEQPMPTTPPAPPRILAKIELVYMSDRSLGVSVPPDDTLALGMLMRAIGYVQTKDLRRNGGGLVVPVGAVPGL